MPGALDPLAQLLRSRESDAGPGGRKPLVQAAHLQTWDPVTYANTVTIGGAKPLTNLPVLTPAALSVGRVLLINTDGGPVILGRIHRPSGV